MKTTILRNTIRGLVLLLGLAVLSGCSDDDSTGNNNNVNQNNNNGSTLCGNGILEQGEQCDDGVANSDLDPDACRSDCRDPWCGDGVLDTSEECDGDAMPAGASCMEYSPYDAGELGCTATCEIDTSGCTECGDSVAEGDEACDGTDLQGGTCASVTGLQSGNLGCATDCSYDTSGCWSCGNGHVEGPEACDDGDTSPGDGCSDTCQVEDYWLCNGDPSVCSCVVYVDQDPFIPASSRDGKSWASAYATVSEGLDRATVFSQNHGDIDCEVWVAAGRYYLYKTQKYDWLLLASNVSLYGGFAGTETARDQRDWVTNVTELDARKEWGSTSLIIYHILLAYDVSNATVDGFTLQYGLGNSGDINGFGAGAYLSVTDDFTIRNCIFKNNHGRMGAALFAGATTNTRIENCLFIDNYATETTTYQYANDGGAVLSLDAEITFTNCTFSGNVAGATGGALYNGTMGGTMVAPILQNCILWGNTPDALDDDGLAPVVRYSDIQDAGYAGSNGNIHVDPQFVADYYLSATSPCIDVADDAVAPATDGAGQSRSDIASVGTTGTTADLGAYEYQP